MRNNKSTEFISFIKTYNGGYTDFSNIRCWLESRPTYKRCETVGQLKALIGANPNFEKRHVDKLEAAEAFYFANKHLFVSEPEDDK